MRLHLLFQRQDVAEFLQEEIIDHRDGMDACGIPAAAQQFGDREHAQVVLDGNALPQLFLAQCGDLTVFDVVTLHLQ